MKYQEAKVGVRVIYVNRDSGGDKKDNPLWGGDYGHVVGTIFQIDRQKGHAVRVEWDNGTKNGYKASALEIYDESTVAERVKASVQKVGDWVRPYQKYVALFALAAAADHFILGGKFTSRFKELAGALVTRTMDGIDRMIDKISLGPKE